MFFLFVGSSGLTEASFPRNLTIPQLLRSKVWAIVPFVMKGPTTVFTPRGLACRAVAKGEGGAPHQFTPMSGAHQSLHSTPR